MITSDSQDIFGRKFIKEETRLRNPLMNGFNRIVTSDDKTIAYTKEGTIQFVPLTDFNDNSVSTSLVLDNNSFSLSSSDATISFVPDNAENYLNISLGDSNIKLTETELLLSSNTKKKYSDDEIYEIITTKEINEHNENSDSHLNLFKPIDDRVTEIETEKNKLIVNQPSSSENLVLNSINWLSLTNYSPKSGSNYYINGVLTQVLNSFANKPHTDYICDTCEVWVTTDLTSLGNGDESTEISINNPETININWIDDEVPTFYNKKLYSIIFRRIPISLNQYMILANVAYETKLNKIINT